MGMQANAAANLSNEIVKLSADLGSFNDLPTEQVTTVEYLHIIGLIKEGEIEGFSDQINGPYILTINYTQNLGSVMSIMSCLLAQQPRKTFVRLLIQQSSSGLTPCDIPIIFMSN